jgi:uncharacterized membrane protein
VSLPTPQPAALSPSGVAPPGSAPRPLPPRGSGTTLAWGLAAAFFTLYATLSVSDQQHLLTTGFDLGIFDEAVHAYAHGHLPVVPLKGPGFDLLGDHFSPIWAVLAPFYRIFPTVYTLLIAQAALLAVAVVPLVRWATREVGRTAAAVAGLGYGASWGIASAAGFDVHEVAWAVPMLAFAAAALGQRRWGAAAAWALPLLLVKEDLGLTVAAIGLYIAWHGARRLGLATAAAGLAGTWLEVKILIPAASPSGTYAYTSYLGGSGLGSGPLGVGDAILRFVTPEIKLSTVLVMLAPTAFLALRSPLTLLTVPTLAWRFLADNPVYWGTADQYSAVLMPIVFAAFVHALSRPQVTGGRRDTVIIRTALAISLAVTVLLLPDYPFWRLASPPGGPSSWRIAAAHQVMDLIPDGAVVAAGDQLVPQLTDRDTVALLGTGIPQRPAWVIADTWTPFGFPISGQQQATLIAQWRAEGYRTVADESGYLLLHRP